MASVFSQESPETRLYALDPASETVAYKGDLGQLVSELTQNAVSEEEKARAIYIWITQNIAYDCKAYNKGRKPKAVKCPRKEVCRAKIAARDEKYSNDVLRKKKGVCQGYAMLFQKMCGMAGIRCSVVAGYTKKTPGQIGKMGALNHAWNFVILDGQSYYLDATWAAGGVTYDQKGRLDPFIFDRDDYYWLTPTDKLHRNHFPADTIFPGTSKAEKLRYKNQPYILPTGLLHLDVIAPETGMLTPRLYDTIRFSIDYQGNLAKRQLNTAVFRNPNVIRESQDSLYMDQRALLRQKYVVFKRTGNRIDFEYVVEDPKINFIDVLFDYERKVRFRMQMTN